MRVRRLLIAGFCAAALTLAACGDDDDDGAGVQRACSAQVPSSAEWEGNVYANTTDDNFNVATGEFNDFLADAEPPVSTSPCDAARVFLKIDERQGEEGSDYQVAAEPGDSADAEVDLTLSNIPDDSILAERWNLTFEAAEGDSIRLVEAKREQSCRPGRGHSKFSSKPCL